MIVNLDRTIGVGIPYEDEALTVACGRCPALEGQYCPHRAVRRSRASRLHSRDAYRLHQQLLAREAADRDPAGLSLLEQRSPVPLYQLDGAHQCGTLGAHVLSTCTPLPGEELPDPYCPFAADGKCPGECPSQEQRACILGEEDAL